MFTLGVIVGAVVASIVWWIEVRGLKGTISDLKDVSSDAKQLADKAKSP
jgi:hypothetical protein